MASALERQDPAVYTAVVGEERRLREHIQLIPSENYPSAAVLEANGSVMTQKYAEGYPGYRFYQGCRWVDEVEDLARRRARRLFKAGRANVQPHSGSAANMAVYFAALEPGDTVLAPAGIKHGFVNRSGERAALLAVFPKTEFQRVPVE